MPCEYCGESHGVEALCAPRMKVSRRRFLFLGMGAVAAAVMAPSLLFPTDVNYLQMTDLDPYKTNAVLSRKLYRIIPGEPNRYVLLCTIPHGESSVTIGGSTFYEFPNV